MTAKKKPDDKEKFDAIKMFDKVLDILYILNSILGIVLPILNAIYEGIKEGKIGKQSRKDVEKDVKGVPEKILKLTFGQKPKDDKEDKS